MDPLSNIISLLHPHDCVAAGLDAGGDWSIQFERHDGLKCNAVLKGSCWLLVDGVAEAQRLSAGDCVILPKGRPFLLSARNLSLGEDANTIYAPVRHGGTAVYQGGGDFFMMGSRFLLSGTSADILLRTLPPIIFARSGSEQGVIQWSLMRIADELRMPQPGSALSINHLAHFILIQIMRSYLNDVPPEATGWIAALADPYINRAVVAIHSEPARAWTVDALARLAGQSRTAFAIRFREVTNQTPIAYLTQWRMLFAAEQLRRTDLPIIRIAEDVGYTSESAFSVAFKRAMGCSPRRFANYFKNERDK